jgi:hypothetical protein
MAGPHEMLLYWFGDHELECVSRAARATAAAAMMQHAVTIRL